MDCDNVKTKDPGAKLDYKFDWAPLTNGSPGGVSDWLEPGETISSFTITPDSGITVDLSVLADSDTSVVVWLSGGDVNNIYKVICHIVTSSSIPREDDRTLYVKMVQK